MLIDGVPVFAAEGPAPTTAGLVFGVGRADETFVRGGLTHLVEHLVMGAVGRTPYDSNASVDLHRTEFTASGTPDQVRDFLDRVCRALGDLPVERLRVEADVLRTEGGAAALPAVGRLLTERYGVCGPGLASVREPALASLTAADVHEWVRARFTRQNAALWLSGPVPEGLALPLADGAPPPPRRPLWRAEVTTPGWVETGDAGVVSVGAELPPGIAGSVTLELLRRRVEDELRHRRGVAYAVTADRLPLDAATRFGVVVTDVRAGQEDLVVVVLWREVQQLAHDGPTPEELEHERAALGSLFDDPRVRTEEAASHAVARVTGIPTSGADEMRRELAALTAADIRESAGRQRDGALLGVPETPDPAPPGLIQVPMWSAEAVQGRVFRRRRLTGVPKGTTLVVGDDGVSVVLDQGPITVRWADAVGLVRQGPGEFQLLGRDGFTVPLSEADWRDGDEALAMVRAAVPDDLQVDDDDIDEPAGVLLFRAPEHRVREAIAMSNHGATVVANDEWTAIVADDAPEFLVRLAELTAPLGRRAVALTLRQTHADLEYVLFRGWNETTRHRWGIAPADPQALADAVQRPEESMARLHGAVGTPRDIAEEAVAVLGLPAEVPALLAGEAVTGGRRIEGAGSLGGFRASMRGEFLPEEGKWKPLERYLALSRRRPAWFRALNAAGVLVYALVLWGLFARREHFHGWLFWVLVVVCGASLLNALWDARPLRRPGGEADSVPAEPQRTPTG